MQLPGLLLLLLLLLLLFLLFLLLLLVLLLELALQASLLLLLASKTLSALTRSPLPSAGVGGFHFCNVPPVDVTTMCQVRKARRVHGRPVQSDSKQFKRLAYATSRSVQT